MANIGTFKQVGEGEYMGEINTLRLRLSGVHIVPESSRGNDNAPTHRAFCGKIELGACWTNCSKEGREYLSVKLDDPSLSAPIFANLFADEGGETFGLIWSRRTKSNGD